MRSGLVLLILSVLTSCLSWAAGAAQADQIVVLVDRNGHKVYVNTGDPANRSEGPGNQSSLLGDLPSAPANIDKIVKRTANHFAIDPHLVDAIIEVESRYNPKAVSPKGAMGLMQLVPATATRFGVNNPFDPRQNIRGGVSYLKYLMGLFGGNLKLALAAYNAGENAVMRSGGIPAITETRDYVRKVTSIYQDGSYLGSSLTKSAARGKEQAPIYQYVDAQGVVHFANAE